MSPEFYAIIGSAVGLAILIIGLSGIFLYLLSQTNRRMDRLEIRMDRLEDRMERMEDRFVESINLLREQVHSLDKRVAKVEWLLEMQLGGRARPSEPSEE